MPEVTLLPAPTLKCEASIPAARSFSVRIPVAVWQMLVSFECSRHMFFCFFNESSNELNCLINDRTARQSTSGSAVFSIGTSAPSIRIEWQSSEIDAANGRIRLQFDVEEHGYRSTVNVASALAAIVSASSSKRTWYVIFSFISQFVLFRFFS